MQCVYSFKIQHASHIPSPLLQQAPPHSTAASPSIHTAAMDMLQSANNAILYTKSSIDNFSSGVDDLADSVGVGPFLGLVAVAVAFAAGLGSISLSGIARVDEYFGWPLWTSIFPNWRSDEAKERLKIR